MRIQPFRAVLPQLDQIEISFDQFCETAKDHYPIIRDTPQVQQREKVGLYILQIETSQRQHTGLVALNHVADFAEGRIKKHEKTLAAREEDYFHLLQNWQAIIKPVLLTYDDSAQQITAWLQTYCARHTPLFVHFFEKSGETHRLWSIEQPTDIDAVQVLFAGIDSVYIADGHHRTTTIARLSLQAEGNASGLDFSHIFSAFFASDQLSILGYHRVVQVTEAFDFQAFIQQLEAVFSIEKIDAPRAPAAPHELVLLHNTKYYTLTWQAPTPPDGIVLDATLLNEHVLQNILGIEDVRKDQRIRYVDGSQGWQGVANAVAKDPECLLGFVLHPISFEALRMLSNRQESLPPKSTWFEPRLKSGLIIQSLTATGA
jgi:uncharacterized protein (DUF1015 family)